MRFKIIRVGTGFDPVIVVSPENATFDIMNPELDTPNATYYRLASWKIGDHEPDRFNEISRELAITYFSGIADGIGFEEPPAEPFESLDVALAFVNEKRNELGEAMRKRLNELQRNRTGNMFDID